MLQSRLVGFLLTLGVLCWLFCLRRRRQIQARAERLFAARHGCLPPSPWGAKYPLGLDYLFKAFRKSRQQQKLLGSQVIGTIDPSNIEAILSTNFQDYSLGLRAPTFYPLLGSGIFTQDGTSWRHSQQLLRPQFLANWSPNFEQIKKCVEGLIAAVPAGGIADLQPLCFRLTFDTTMFLLFGDSVAAEDWGQGRVCSGGISDILGRIYGLQNYHRHTLFACFGRYLNSASAHINHYLLHDSDALYCCEDQ